MEETQSILALVGGIRQHFNGSVFSLFMAVIKHPQVQMSTASDRLSLLRGTTVSGILLILTDLHGCDNTPDVCKKSQY